MKHLFKSHLNVMCILLLQGWIRKIRRLLKLERNVRSVELFFELLIKKLLMILGFKILGSMILYHKDCKIFILLFKLPSSKHSRQIFPIASLMMQNKILERSKNSHSSLPVFVGNHRYLTFIMHLN